MLKYIFLFLVISSSNCFAVDTIKNSYGQTQATKTRSGSYYDSYGRYLGKQKGNTFYDKNNKNIGTGKSYHPKIGGGNGTNKK